jgi:hypothetical protein
MHSSLRCKNDHRPHAIAGDGRRRLAPNTVDATIRVIDTARPAVPRVASRPSGPVPAAH